MKIGDIIMQYIHENGMNQSEFAKKSDLTKGYISMLINGINPQTKKPFTRLSGDTIVKLSKAMNMTVNELLEQMDNMKVSPEPNIPNMTTIAYTPARAMVPIIGAVRCAVCGRMLIRISGHGHDILMCPRRRECPTRAIPIHRAEEAILEGLQGWTVKYTTPPPKEPKTAPELSVIVQQKDKLEAKLKRAFELVEMGIYTPQIFVERRDALQEKIATLDRRAEELKTAPTVEDGILKCLPFVGHVIDAYQIAETVKEKNELLKSIVDHVDYAREGETAPEFTIYPRILPE